MERGLVLCFAGQWDLSQPKHTTVTKHIDRQHNRYKPELWVHSFVGCVWYQHKNMSSIIPYHKLFVSDVKCMFWYMCNTNDRAEQVGSHMLLPFSKRTIRIRLAQSLSFRMALQPRHAHPSAAMLWGPQVQGPRPSGANMNPHKPSTMYAIVLLAPRLNIVVSSAIQL